MLKWFDADKDGLRQIGERLIESRGFGIILAELYQNCMDTQATTCDIILEKTDRRGKYRLVCEDNDPTGFVDLAHAYTVFAPSLKKTDPTKAGRFNIGEKFVLAFCDEAKISTTTGTVIFSAKGREEHPRLKRPRGTLFTAIINCNETRLIDVAAYMPKLLVKPGLRLTVNGKVIESRVPFASFQETLATEISDANGDLRPTRRLTNVQLFEVLPGETAMLYELGIPVVETGDKWHYSVCQKVPLNTDRDNVTPAFLRDLRVHVFNYMHPKINEFDTESPWVNEATSDEKCEHEALEDFKTKKYGKNSVALDPFNPEANCEAAAQGFTVIPSHGLSKGQRENLKKHELLISSTQMFPLAGKGAYSDDPNAPPVVPLTNSELSSGMIDIMEYTQGVAQRLLGKKITILFVKVPRRHCEGKPWAACYGRGHLSSGSEFHYNVGVLGRAWFDAGVTENVDSLIIHELGHEFESNHLSDGYYKALTKLGARLKAAALDDPKWFRKFIKEK